MHRSKDKKSLTLTKPLALFKATWQLINNSRTAFLKVIAVGLLVNVVLTLSGESGQVYQSIWFIIYSTSLIWLIRQLTEKSKLPSTKQVYYQGSAPLLKFFLVTVFLALTAIPFSIGAFIYQTIAVQTVTAGVSTEVIIVGLIWLSLAVLTIYLLIRSIFSMLIVTLPTATPISALRLSWRITKKKVAAILGRITLAVILLSILVMSIMLLLTSIFKNGQGFITSLSDLIIIGVVLPFLYAYLYIMYRELL